ncbi:MAG: hypothetical protein IPI42_08655 [Saprospiraceae bacterium]|nr:hypothetical protein [Candidatus Parvibacillus calidus]
MREQSGGRCRLLFMRNTSMDNDAAYQKVCLLGLQAIPRIIWLVTDLYNSPLWMFPGRLATFPSTMPWMASFRKAGTGQRLEARLSQHTKRVIVLAFTTLFREWKNDDSLIDGDKAGDTPPVGSPSFAPCNTNSCHTDTPDLPDDNSNFIEDSSRFTGTFYSGQKTRILSGLELSRPSLLTSIVLQPGT